MTGIFGKVRVLALGNIHALLNRAIDLSSLNVVEQHVRDLDNADEELGDNVAVAQGRLVQATTAVTRTETAISTTDSNIKLILGDDDASNDHLAETLEAKMIGLEQTLIAQRQTVTTQQELLDSLTQAKQRLSEKLTEMQNRLAELRSMEEGTAAKEEAAAALQGASRIADRAGSVSTDSVVQRMQERSSVADARFKRALGSVADSIDVGVVAVQARERIAARRAAMDKKS